MRIADFLRASFVGALMFTPAMADDIGKVHEEALRVLRQKLGQANEDLPAPAVSPATATVHAPALSVDPEMQRIRAEREARIKVEAERRIAERERLQAERRQQFEAYLKQRELLREQQKAYDENAARFTGQIRNSSESEVHERALAVLHKLEATQSPVQVAAVQPAVAPAAPVITAQTQAVTSRSSTPAVATPEPASSEVTDRALQIVRERKMAAASAPSSSATTAPVQVAQTDADAIHAQALEALHQFQNQNQASTAVKAPAPKTVAPAKPASTTVTPSPTKNTGATTSAPSTSPQPSPELQKRLKQMQLELEQEQMQKNTKETTAKQTQVQTQQSRFPDGYIKDLEERAKQSVQQGPMTTPPPASTALATHAQPAASGNGLDPATRDMIRRQNEEISRQMGSNATAPKGGVSSQSAPSSGVRATATTTAAPSSAPSSTASAKPAPSKPSGPKVAQRVESDTTNVQYSKDLEERARQILAERAQNPSTATMQAPAAPVTTPPVASAPAPVAQPASRVEPSAPAAPAVSTTTVAAPAPVAAPAATAAASAAAERASQAPVASAAPASDVHAQALQTLNQIESGTATGPKNKQQRLKELTDLYRADKIGPAEYHQKRAQIIAEPQ